MYSALHPRVKSPGRLTKEEDKDRGFEATEESLSEEEDPSLSTR